MQLSVVPSELATMGLVASLDQALRKASDTKNWTKKKHQKQGENLHFSNAAFGSAVWLHKSETF